MNLDIKKKNLNFIYNNIKISKDICNIICNYMENNIVRIIYTKIPLNEENLHFKIDIEFFDKLLDSYYLSLINMFNIDRKDDIYIQAKCEQEACIKFFNYIYLRNKKETLRVLKILEDELIQYKEHSTIVKFKYDEVKMYLFYFIDKCEGNFILIN
jgi:hypothetical protein